jgi:hypothetical protein
MLRYLILIGALAAMPLSGFAAVETVDKEAATANLEPSKTEGPVWVVEESKVSPTQGPVWVVMKPKGIKTV